LLQTIEATLLACTTLCFPFTTVSSPTLLRTFLHNPARLNNHCHAPRPQASHSKTGIQVPSFAARVRAVGLSHPAPCQANCDVRCRCFLNLHAPPHPSFSSRMLCSGPCLNNCTPPGQFKVGFFTDACYVQLKIVAFGKDQVVTSVGLVLTTSRLIYWT